MKLINTILLVIIAVCLLNLQSGCQEAQKTPEPQQMVTVTPKTEENAQAPEVVKAPDVVKKPKQVQPEPQPKKGKPVIKVEKLVHDFGKVGPNKKYNCEFEFKNAGDDTLRITRIQSTCGCTVTQLKKKVYAPGESGTVKVTFRTPTRQGSTTKNLYILSNDKKNTKFELALKAIVELKVEATPKSLNLSLKAENAGIKPITIKSKDGRPFAIKSFTSTANVITAGFDTALEATEFVLEPKVDIEKLTKNLKGNIRVNVTHPQASMINIAYSTLPLFEVSHPRIIIQNADPSKPITRNVVVKSNYNNTVQIESISSSKQFMKVLSQQPEDSSVTVEVQITPPEQSKKLKRYFTDEMKIKMKNGDELIVKCSGWYPRKSAKSK